MDNANEPAPEPAHSPAHEERRRRLGRIIRSLRGDRTQAELGLALGGVIQTTISRWENGLVDLTMEQVLELERALEVKPGTLGSVAGYIEPDLVSSSPSAPRDHIVTQYHDIHEEMLDALRAAVTLNFGVRLKNVWQQEASGGSTLLWELELRMEPPERAGYGE